MDSTNFFFGIDFKYPSAQGIFNSGVFAAIGFFLWYFLFALIIILVGFSIYGAFKISLSQGDEKKIEEGTTLIKNVWISAAWGILFFIILSIIGNLFGIGDITQWNTKLAQCKGSNGGYYFGDIASQEVAYIPTKQMYCCMVNDIKSAPYPYSTLDFPNNTGHFIGVEVGGVPPSGNFTDCVKY